jgi:hypothetical protein
VPDPTHRLAGGLELGGMVVTPADVDPGGHRTSSPTSRRRSSTAAA